MNGKRLSLCVATLALLLGASGFANANGNWGQPKVIDCDKGMNPQHFLDQRLFSRPIELYLKGTCPSLTIERDDVLLSGDPEVGCPGAVISGRLLVHGANRTRIQCLEVTDGFDDVGIHIQGGTAYLEDVFVNGVMGIGLNIASGAYVEVLTSHFEANGEGINIERASASIDSTTVVGNWGIGINLEHNSSLEFLDGIVEWNEHVGISLAANSTAVVEGADIHWNGSTGVRATQNSDVAIAASRITNNARIIFFRSGIFLNDNSSADVSDVVISANTVGIGVSTHSTLHVRGDQTLIEANTFDGIRLSRDSAARIYAGVEIPPNGSGLAINCYDTESSLDNYSVSIGPDTCDGF